MFKSIILSLAFVAGMTPSIYAQDTLKNLSESYLGYEACVSAATEIHSKLFKDTRFKEDILLRGVPEYYASSIETEKSGMGDCDDFALYLYSSLRKLGCSLDNLQIVYYSPKNPKDPAHMNLRLKPALGSQGPKVSYYFDVSRAEPYSEEEWKEASSRYEVVQIMDEINWKILDKSVTFDSSENPFFSEWKFKEEIQQGIEFKSTENVGFLTVIYNYVLNIINSIASYFND